MTDTCERSEGGPLRGGQGWGGRKINGAEEDEKGSPLIYLHLLALVFLCSSCVFKSGFYFLTPSTGPVTVGLWAES